MKIVIAKPGYKDNSPTGYKMLEDKGYEIVHIPYSRDYTMEELKAVVSDIDGIIADSEPWNEESLCCAPKLKIISRYGVGMDSVDTEACKRHGVMVTNCPGVNANPVAEHAVAMLLCAKRNLIKINETTPPGQWKQYLFSELSGQTVGIIGFGYIGQKVAQKLMGFECNIVAYDVVHNEEMAEKTNTKFVDLEYLLTKSDIICLHCPLTPETYHLINSETLRKTKRGVIFVSEARGEVVDEVAMYDALTSGQVAYFATDVFEHEPATPDNTPILTLENVFASSHNGGETYENSERCGILTAKHLIDALEGREPESRRV